MVQPPKGPKQILSLLRGPKGYEARFRPDVQGIWSFYILRKNKRLDGIWKFPGKLKVVPSKLPGPIGVHPRTRKHFISKNRPFFFFAKPVPGLLSPTWSHKAFEQTLAALQNRYIGASVLHIDLPLIPWKNAADKRPFKASRPLWSNAAELVLSMIEKRLSALHEKGFQISLGIDPAHWKGVSKKEQMARLKYLLDRFGTAYPLLWFVDLRKRGKLPKKGAPMAWMKQVFTMWYRLRYPLPAPSKNPRKGRRVLTPPPMLGALMGAPRSEKELKQIAPAFDMLWFDVKSLLPALKNFKLYAFKKPVILTWQPMLEKDFTFITKKKTKKGAAKNRQLLRWARFLWQSHLFGFSHAGRPITAALRPLDPKKQTKWKPAASERVPAMMRAFFQTFDWTQMAPMLKSVKVKSYQAFGAETPFNPKGKNKQHHLVLWSRATVRRQLEVKRNFPLKKHRYIWLDPLTGKRPLSAQLLPPMPTNKQPDKMEVPFRPAILYIFRRPPQRGRKNQQRQQRKQKKQQKQLSKRQQIRNRLRRMQEDRNKFLRKLLKKQKPKSVSGKRG
ncbi:MAG TPA: hypothetical protein DCE42_12900 [Myxococcales bacterium]|nr:hypothetical protein [Myxococcales bacterium]